MFQKNGGLEGGKEAGDRVTFLGKALELQQGCLDGGFGSFNLSKCTLRLVLSFRWEKEKDFFVKVEKSEKNFIFYERGRGFSRREERRVVVVGAGAECQEKALLDVLW